MASGEVRVTSTTLQVLGNSNIPPSGEVRVASTTLQVLGNSNATISGTVTLNWQDPNDVEDGHYIYRDTAPMDPDNLPAPHATLGADVTTWSEQDDFLMASTYYYRVAAFKGALIKVSDEIKVDI